MQYLLSKEQTYDLENKVLDIHSISLETLMYEAGRSVWFQFLNEYGHKPSKICIFLGSGNNAGDGLVLALEAIKMGVEVALIEVKPLKAKLPKKIFKTHYKQLTTCYIEDFDINTYEVIVDAIFGIGYKPNGSLDVDQWIHAFNTSKAYKLAVDIPSGIDANSGLGKLYCDVDLTITFFAKKIGLVLSQGKSASKKTIVALRHYLITEDCFNVVKACDLPERKAYVHKYQCGNVAVIGGSKGMEGAGILSAIAALRSGAGVVRYYGLGELTHMEPSIIYEKFSQSCFDLLVNKHTVCVIGPGLLDGNEIVAEALQRDLILILDAGALKSLPKDISLNNQCILTPHIGEAAYLLNVSSDCVINNPLDSAQKLYQQYQTPIVLKGASTIIVMDAEVSFVVNGSACLATAGSGDVLAGMIASLVAQHGFNRGAIEQAVYQHALFSEQWQQNETTPMIASDILGSNYDE